MLLTYLIPIFLLTGLGALLAWRGWLRPGWHSGLTELTAKVLIPALLFSGTYRTGIPATVSWQLLGAYYLPLVSLFLLIAFLGRAREDGAARALTATFSNTVFVGIPVLVNAFGEASLQYAFPIIAVHSLTGFTLYYLLSPSKAKGARRVAYALAGAVKNPIVLALFMGLALNLSGLRLPLALAKPLDMLTPAALPCALVALGASLVSLHLASRAETYATVTLKLALLPLCVIAMAVFVFKLPAPAAAVLVILASCPVGVNVAFVVGADGTAAAPVNSAILMSSLLSAATIPCWLWIATQL